MENRGRVGGEDVFVHRKGAGPSNQGTVVIPGSRESFSYLVEPIGDEEAYAHSLAHGAGRNWARSGCKERLQKGDKKITRESLERTELWSQVICEDGNLIFEEAGRESKDIESVIDALETHGLNRVVAVLRPVVTYKVGRSEGEDLDGEG